MSTDPFSDNNDTFMESGGGYPGFEFKQIGARAEGVVTAVKERPDTEPNGTIKTWKNGDPKKCWVMEVDTDGTDDGMRSLWVRGNLVKVLRDAVSAAGFKSIIGTKITVEHHALGEVTVKGNHPAKLFRAKVESAPARAAADAGSEPW